MIDSDRMILAFLQQQRASVLQIVDGMPDYLIRSPALPSGWTPIGLIQHLADNERYWVKQIAAGGAEASTWDPDDPDAEWRVGADTSVASVLDSYRAETAEVDRLLIDLNWDAPTANREDRWAPSDVSNSRWVVLHLIEETARHAGHLDAARELLDGRVGLGGN